MEQKLKNALEFLFGPLIPTALLTVLAMYSILSLPVALPLWWGYRLSRDVNSRSSSVSERFFKKGLELISIPYILLDVEMSM